jgi:hypothetical protein
MRSRNLPDFRDMMMKMPGQKAVQAREAGIAGKSETMAKRRWLMNGIFPILLVAALLLPVVTEAAASRDAAMQCKPTLADQLGPFYVPDAPVRAKVGEGYVLSGTVKSAADCAAIAGAKIEFWLAGPSGSYDDDHRATLIADGSGGYRFESNFPPGYGRRPPHIHIRVSAAGFDTLVTQHYPETGKSGASFDLVLIPAR